MNIFSLLDASGRRFAGSGAVYDGVNLVCDYGQLRQRALALASGLRQRGLTGQRIAVVTANCPQYVEILFGIWAADAVAVPVNAKLHVREMQQIMEDCDARLVLASATWAEALAEVPGGSACIQIGSSAYEALFDEPAAVPTSTAPDALAWLFYTSGTTGRSKGAMLTHRNLLAMTLSHLADVDDIGNGDTQIHGAPMSHGSGLYIPAYVSRGARQVVPTSGGFETAEVIELCNAHPRCGMFLAPTMVQRLRLELEQTGRRPAGLRTIVYGGGPMYVDELRQSIAAFGQVFTQIYGQGESPMTITWLPRADHERDDPAVLGSVGIPRTGMMVRVVNDVGNDMPHGETGEIVCSGETVMAGYWNDAEATGRALQGGWLYTGDMGSLSADGYLTLRDRSKDLIISGGSNIYPREVEEVLLTHPSVREACVVGKPDAEWGELVIAFVVAAPQVETQDLDAHCLESIARFKRPKQYIFVDELPKNSYGKVLKRELRKRFDS